MLLKYSYENLNHVIDLFNNNRMASFKITQTEDKTFIMDYSVIDVYTSKEQLLISKVLERSLAERLCVIQLLHDFLEAMCEQKDISFELTFNAVNVKKCEFTFALSGFNLGKKPKDNIQRLHSCLCQLDEILTDMGIIDTEIAGVYMKNPRGRKYQATTFGQLNHAIRKAIDKCCNK